MEAFRRLMKYLDTKVRPRTGILWVCAVSVLLAFIIGTCRPIGDFWTHYTWMKITHRLPVKDWYDNNAHNHLDYPHLAGYLHYLMGFVVRLFDPDSFYNTPMYDDVPVTFGIKYGIRLVVVLINLIFYYPAAINMTLFTQRTERLSHKLVVLFLMLNMPMYSYIEFGSTQVNGPHLGLLLWSLYLAMQTRFCASTVCFTLSMSYKHFNGPFVIPIASYIIVLLWRKHAPASRSVLDFFPSQHRLRQDSRCCSWNARRCSAWDS